MQWVQHVLCSKTQLVTERRVTRTDISDSVLLWRDASTRGGSRLRGGSCCKERETYADDAWEEREKKEQKALEKIAVPLKKNSDFMVDEYDVEGSMQVEESDGTFVDCRLYRHKSKKRNVVLYFSNGLFEGIDLNYTFENGVLKDDDGQLISYKKFISANGRAANKKVWTG